MPAASNCQLRGCQMNCHYRHRLAVTRAKPSPRSDQAGASHRHAVKSTSLTAHTQEFLMAISLKVNGTARSVDAEMQASRLTRRDFTTALGGIVLSFGLGSGVASGQGPQTPARLPGSLQANRMLDAWLRIDADGKVTVFTGKVELGQGIVTALAQI